MVAADVLMCHPGRPGCRHWLQDDISGHATVNAATRMARNTAACAGRGHVFELKGAPAQPDP